MCRDGMQRLWYVPDAELSSACDGAHLKGTDGCNFIHQDQLFFVRDPSAESIYDKAERYALAEPRGLDVLWALLQRLLEPSYCASLAPDLEHSLNSNL